MSIPLLIVCVVGLLTWALAKGITSEIGRIIFTCAFLALCFGQAPRFLRLQ